MESLQGWAVAGVDEAGLGPLLGPLCIGGALFRSAPSQPTTPKPPTSYDAVLSHVRALLERDWWQELGPLTGRTVAEKRPLTVCDSKLLHSASKGVGPLERNVLPWLGAARGGLPRTAADLVGAGKSLPMDEWLSYPWYAADDLPLPLAALEEKAAIQAGLIHQRLTALNLELAACGSLPVLEGEFNRLIDAHGNKSDVDCAAVAAVLLRMMRQNRLLAVACDALGARQHYAAALRAMLETDDVAIIEEGEGRSDYLVSKPYGPHEHLLYISFRVGGEGQSFLTALASMCAKYTREVCMEQLNRYFCARQEGLKPTKGYVQDGRRWLIDTESLRRRLGIPDTLLIRCR